MSSVKQRRHVGRRWNPEHQSKTKQSEIHSSSSRPSLSPHQKTQNMLPDEARPAAPHWCCGDRCVHMVGVSAVPDRREKEGGESKTTKRNKEGHKERTNREGSCSAAVISSLIWLLYYSSVGQIMQSWLYCWQPARVHMLAIRGSRCLHAAASSSVVLRQGSQGSFLHAYLLPFAAQVGCAQTKSWAKVLKIIQEKHPRLEAHDCSFQSII